MNLPSLPWPSVRSIAATALILLTELGPTAATAAEESPALEHDVLEWSQLAPLPDPEGVAAPFAGISHGALIVAGGANFPDARPWDGGTKQWYDDIYVLPTPKSEWQQGFQLPRPLAYGASVSWNDRVVCLGGGDAEQHYNDVFTLRWADGNIEVEDLAPMPGPCAFGAAVLVGDKVYVAGGIVAPPVTQAMHNFWVCDLKTQQWTMLDPWPGKPRMLATLGTLDGKVYLFGGTRLYANADGTATREYLTDCYVFDPSPAPWGAWRQIADLPRPVVAAPTPAMQLGYSHLAVLSGDDGALFDTAAELKGDHPGFPPEVFAYNTVTNAWAVMSMFPKQPAADGGGVWPPVTATVVAWNGAYVIPSGEARPGIRTNRVMFAKPARLPNKFLVPDWIVLIVYLLAMVAIGWVFSRREGTTDDYFLAGRRVPWWAAGISIFGTTLSAITYLAIPARAFATDWAPFLLAFGIVLVAPLVVFYYLPFFRRLNITTAYEYLEKRFDVGLRLFGSVSFVAYQLGRMAIVVLLPALALSAVTGIDVSLCILVMGVLSTLYTVLGGIEAVIWTDVVQVFVLLAGAISALGIIVSNIEGGFSTIFATGLAEGKFQLVHWSWDWTGDALLVIVLGGLISNALVPYTTDQAVVQRYLTTRDQRQAARAVWTNAAMALPTAVLFFLVGTALFVFYKTHAQALLPLEKSDQIFAWFIAEQMPPGLTGLVIAGVFAAAMSSLDSSMHSVATVITTDFVQRFRPHITQPQLLAVARLLTVAIGVLGTGTALWLAQIHIEHLWDYFLSMLGLIGGPLAGLFLLGIFTRRPASLHAWCGVLVSLGVLFYVRLYTPLNGLLYGAIGVGVCFTVGWLAALMTPHTSRDLAGLTVHDPPPAE